MYLQDLRAILVLAGPIWLGENSSMMKKVRGAGRGPRRWVKEAGSCCPVQLKAALSE